MEEKAMSDTLKSLSRTDRIRIGAAVIFFISSFLPFVGASVGDSGLGLHISVSENAWHSFALLGVLLVLVAIAVWALQRFTAVELPTWQVAWGVAIPALAALGTLLIFLRAITYGSPIGLRYGAFLVVISGIVFAVSTYDRSSTVS
jgi:hypothetical protein